MRIPILHSAKQIERQFHTGEEPVLVMCSDVNTYVCKYMRSSTASYKLVCELIGSQMAKAWQLNTPKIAFVKIRSSHWEGINISHNISAPSLGFKWVEGVVDITPSTYAKVSASTNTLYQLMKIALFDFWIANEDRNANNANLMYDVANEHFVSIDYGCIFNTATFDYPLSQLTSTDTILWSDLFVHLNQNQEKESILLLVEKLKDEFHKSLTECSVVCGETIDQIPQEWNVPKVVIREKINQLFDDKWSMQVWNNFVECLNENSTYE